MAKRKREHSNPDPELQSVWRAALREPEGFELVCGDKNEAVRLRFALYNSVRDIRGQPHSEHVDLELWEAVQACSISIEGEERNVLRVQNRKFSTLKLIVQQALAAKGVVAKAQDADAIEGSAARLMARLGMQEMQQVVGLESAPVQATEPTRASGKHSFLEDLLKERQAQRGGQPLDSLAGKTESDPDAK